MPKLFWRRCAALLKWQGNGESKRLNNADKDSRTSCNISFAWGEFRGITSKEADSTSGQEKGKLFESLVHDWLNEAIRESGLEEKYGVHQHLLISEFEQYSHVGTIQSLIDADMSGELETALGDHYLVQPDVVVSIPTSGGKPLLHASISCKWTMRSDRAQNSRTEALNLLKLRKGRAPHILIVTAEPLPTRIASVAKGTGDIDCVYHADLEGLRQAVESVGTPQQKTTLARLMQTDRLRDANDISALLLR